MDDMDLEIGRIMGELKADEAIIESLILNCRNGRVNRYLQESIQGIRHASAELSGALFEITTGPFESDDDFDD